MGVESAVAQLDGGEGLLRVYELSMGFEYFEPIRLLLLENRITFGT